jgi:S-adenosylmethionine:tRNA ribosyltransferase-isomerase
MKLSHFQFDLPKELLAEFRLNTEMKRLMVIDRKKQTIEHKTFKDVIDYFDDGDVLILNNTKVFPARLYGNKEKQEQESKFFYLEN